MEHFFNSPSSIGFAIFLFFAPIVVVRLIILNTRNSNKIKMENQQKQLFWEEVLGKKWDLIPTGIPNWKQIKILQPTVDALLIQKAVALNIACKTATHTINHPLSESRPNEGPDELSQRIYNLQAQESEIETCKKIYWGFSDRAKHLGFKVKESHKDYLPKDMDYSEEPKKLEVFA